MVLLPSSINSSIHRVRWVSSRQVTALRQLAVLLEALVNLNSISLDSRAHTEWYKGHLNSKDLRKVRHKDLLKVRPASRRCNDTLATRVGSLDSSRHKARLALVSNNSKHTRHKVLRLLPLDFSSKDLCKVVTLASHSSTRAWVCSKGHLRADLRPLLARHRQRVTLVDHQEVTLTLGLLHHKDQEIIDILLHRPPLGSSESGHEMRRF